ncbi:MAG: hypothetical protein ONB27_12915 [candidate division KSB1 bacterium]|nr:hypothetical protein [candidate division KSB1 bacterium]
MNKYFGILLLMIFAMASVTVASDYQPRPFIAAAWGNANGEFALSLEAEGNCPQALAVAEDGSIAILDAVNRRVQFYSRAGKWLGAIGIISGAFDIQLRNQEVRVLAPFDQFVSRYRRDGQLIEKIAINPKIQMIDGLGGSEDGIVVRTIEQMQYSLTPNQAQQIQSARSGSSTRIPGVRIRTQWIDSHRGNLTIEQEASRKIQTVTITTQDELGSLVFLDSDRSGNFYVREELFSPDGKPYFEVVKFDGNGTLLATIKIEHENLVMPFKPITIDQYGNIYFLKISADGFLVIQWQER